MTARSVEVDAPVRIVSGGSPHSTAVYVGGQALPGVTRVTWESDAAGGFAHAVVHLADVALDLAASRVELVGIEGGGGDAPEADNP